MVGLLSNFIKIRKPPRLVAVKILRDLLLIKNRLIIIFGLDCFLKKKIMSKKKKKTSQIVNSNDLALYTKE